MSLLFLKVNNKKSGYFLFLLIIILSINSRILANDSIPDLVFKKLCQISDAYLQYSYTDVSYSPSILGYKRQTTFQSKLVVNNRNGIEKYAYVNLNKTVFDHIDLIRVNTLKADGSKVNLDTIEIFKQQLEDKSREFIKYPIPGVEPGDTIEIFYKYSESLNNYELADFVSLYNQVPSYNTEFSITTPPNLEIRYKAYNNFPEPFIISNDTIVYCLFKMEKVQGQNASKYTCFSCELPYVYYSLDKKKSEARTWKDIYNQEFNFITQPISLDNENFTYYNRWKRRVIGNAEDSSKYYKLNLLLHDIIVNYKIEPAKREELVKSSGYFLKEKHFDPISIRRLYRQLLEDLGIKYWAVFARSKRSGEIDPYFIRKGEYDHIFFAYINNDSTLSLLYPHDENFKYQVNEIPTSLYNTEAVIAKPFFTKKLNRKDKFIDFDLKLAEADSVTISVIHLPGMSANSNYIKQVFYCDIDSISRNISFKSNFSVSGGLSTDLRSFFSLLSKNKEMNQFYDALAEYEGDKTTLKIDTVLNAELKNYKPFIFSITAKGTLKNNLTFINDSIVSITMDNLIKHSQIDSEADSSNLNFYMDYSYTDLFILILKFPYDIELLGIDKYNHHIKNSSGEYQFNLNISNNNQLIIKSSYAITKDLIPKTEYEQLKELNGLVKEIKNMRLLVKMKKHIAI